MEGWLAAALLLVIYLARNGSLKEQLSEQRQKNERLQRESEEQSALISRHGRRMDVLLESVDEAVLRVDQLGRVMAANHKAREVFAVRDHIQLPQSMLVFYRDLDWHKAFNRVLKDLSQPAALPDIGINDRVLAVRLAPLGKDQALMLCVDMTHQARLEEQRRNFLANLMHDLKTPLTSLLGYARSIQSFGESAELRNEAAQVIASEAKHVNHLLDSLLTLDRIEYESRATGGQCDVSEILRQALEMMQPLCKSKSIRIDASFPEKNYLIAMSEEDVERILLNVIENACHYSPNESSVSIGVTITNGFCSVSVSDAGPGIPPEHLPRVTERFYRVDQVRGRKEGGHGLGLAIVKALLKRDGGRLQLENLPDKGLRVRVDFPMQQGVSGK